MITRGVRNNNPFNIKISNNCWKGKVSRKNNTDGIFEQFGSMKYGLRAGIRLLMNYHYKHGISEIRHYIMRFAPCSENDTKRYINFVCDFIRNRGYFVYDTSKISPCTDEFWFMLQAILLYESKYSVSLDNLVSAYECD